MTAWQTQTRVEPVANLTVLTHVPTRRRSFVYCVVTSLIPAGTELAQNSASTAPFKTRETQRM